MILDILEKIRVYLASFIAPGVEESKNDEIKMIMAKNGAFTVDLESFKNSNEVKRQIGYLRNEKRA